jgi:hypothetical protein
VEICLRLFVNFLLVNSMERIERSQVLAIKELGTVSAVTLLTVCIRERWLIAQESCD